MEAVGKADDDRTRADKKIEKKNKMQYTSGEEGWSITTCRNPFGIILENLSSQSGIDII
jgi:hypothetical protein